MTPMFAETPPHRSRFIWLTAALAATVFGTFAFARPEPVEVRQPQRIGLCSEQRKHAIVEPLDDVRPPVAADLALYTKGLDGHGRLLATITTSMGTLHCELYGDQAPITVANFVGLATGKKSWKHPGTGAIVRGKPFYDGLTFHRVIPNFMIQGGDPLDRGVGGPGYEFANEISPELKFAPGMLAMANKGDQASNGSQFFITEQTSTWLDGHHTIFGHCEELYVVRDLARVPTTASDHPSAPLTIDSVTISRR
jgi:peptidyl-prolyl cis-trans isomerase A (cyclophilin A)